MKYPHVQLPMNEPVARQKNIIVYFLTEVDVVKAKSGNDGPSIAIDIPNKNIIE